MNRSMIAIVFSLCFSSGPAVFAQEPAPVETEQIEPIAPAVSEENTVAARPAEAPPAETQSAEASPTPPPTNTPTVDPVASDAWQARLPNGLRVVGQRDPHVHSAAVCVLYRVGTADDPDDHTGLAHLTEHLMFTPFGRMPTGFHGLLERSGATDINAVTEAYVTKYCSAIPDVALERALFGEGERMAYLLDGLNAAMVEKERRVVLNEADQRGEGGPSSRLRRLKLEPLHSEDHPIWRGLRVQEDVEDLTLRDVQWFHQRYYTPRNAVLAIVSPRPQDEVMGLVQRYLGHVRGNAEAQHMSVPPMALPEPVTIHFRSRLQTPTVEILWPTPAYHTPGDAEMDYVAQYLEPLIESRLPPRVVMSVSVRQVSDIHGSYFRIGLATVRDVDPERYLPEIDHALNRVRSELIAEERYALIRGAVTSFAGESPWTRASRMGRAVLFGQEPRTRAWESERYGSVTREGVRSAARRYLSPDRRVVVFSTFDEEATGNGRVARRRGTGR